MAEAWFRRAMAQGMARLLALALPGAPADEQAAKACREVWIDALWDDRRWDDALDAARIEQAFKTLTRTSQRWPAPAHLIDALPARAQRPALPEPAATPQQRERIRAILADVRRRMGG